MAEGALTAAPTTSDRDRAIEQLSKHFADDGIELDEFERRAEAVYKAVTLAELHALVADIPAAAAATAMAAMAGRESVMSALVPAYDRIAVVMSSTEREGPLKVARRVDIRTVMGSVELDFTHATFAPGVTNIEIKVLMGNVEILFPGHVRVEYHGSAFLASVETQIGDRTVNANAECVVQVTGRAVLGNLSLRSPSDSRALGSGD